MHKDKFKVFTKGMPEQPKEKSEKQEFLSKGYRLVLRDGNWFAIKNNEEIKIKEKKNDG